MTNKSIDRYGVMGYPVSHSRSPVIHRLFALQTRQNIQYELLQVAPENLTESVKQFQETGGKGLNITLPHKTAVGTVVDRLSDRAMQAGAVNTLAFENGMVYGDNTDGIGLIRDLVNNLEIEISETDILILGAGGATRGIVGPLLNEKPASLVIANRTVDRAKTLAARFSELGDIETYTFRGVPKSRGFGIVINATSAGLRGESPPYPKSAVNGSTLCYDLSYGLSGTPFCQWAQKQGAARAVMGWGMLVEQAAESFQIWRGIRPETTIVLNQLTISAS